MAAGLEAGNVCVNDVIVSYAAPALPFGGVKESGIGRVHGPDGIQEFCQVKSVLTDRLGLGREAWWFPLPKQLGTGRRPGAAAAPPSRAGQQAQGAPALSEPRDLARRRSARPGRPTTTPSSDLWDRCGLTRPWIDARAELELKVDSRPRRPARGRGSPRASWSARSWPGSTVTGAGSTTWRSSRDLRRQGIAAALMAAAEAHLGSLGRAARSTSRCGRTNLEVLALLRRRSATSTTTWSAWASASMSRAR